MPLKAILRRQNLINLALDNVIEEIRDAVGTQGSMANRLNQSIADDGSLLTQAIDTALHSIAEHSDTDEYVRMTKAQSDKLDLIADEAKNLNFIIQVDEDTEIEHVSGPLRIEASTTMTPVFEAPNILKFNTTFPATAAHRHYYGLVPVDVSLVSPDGINFKTTSGSTVFVEGSLRVYINGMRIFESVEVYVPGPLVSDDWVLQSFTPSHTTGTFELSAAVSEDDVVMIDFDVPLAS